MARNYELDPTAAKEANSGGKRITQPDLYIGKFRAAWGETNEKGTESVGLIFVSDEGQEAGPLMLYTHNGKGEALPSYKTLNAIMACMKVRKIAAKPGKVKLYDFDAQADVEREKQTYPELVGPKIGLVLQGEEYENRSGEVKVRMIVAAPFDASTRRMADEVLTSAPEAKSLDRFLGWFEGHKVKPLRANGGRNAGGKPAPASADFIDDEIPF
jgi:hypothetical protein